MKLTILFVAALVASQQPRSVCPMLNTLANHKHLPVNGGSFNLTRLARVFDQVLNVDGNVTGILFNGAISKGLNSTVDKTSISLTSINTPGVSEHDASLVRKDYALSSTLQEFLMVNKTLVGQLAVSAANKKCLTASDIGKFRKSRVLDSQRNNPKFVYNQDIAIRSAGESALILLIFGGAEKCIPLDVMRKFFLEEKFPITFVKPSTRITLPLFQAALTESLLLAQ
jgi:hypothetical protein